MVYILLAMPVLALGGLRNAVFLELHDILLDNPQPSVEFSIARAITSGHSHGHSP